MIFIDVLLIFEILIPIYSIVWVCGNAKESKRFWEYDSLQVSEPDRPRGANTVSLNDYRKIYQKLRNENPNFSCRNQDDMERILSLINGDCN